MAQLKSTVVQGSLSVTDTIYMNGKTLVDLIYPVGAIYMSANSTNPSTLFPDTTWVQLKDRFLLGVGDTYEITQENGGIGGEAEHTLTTDEMPYHFHYPYGADLETCGDWCYTLIKNISNRSGALEMEPPVSGSSYKRYGFASNSTYNDLYLRQQNGPAGGHEAHNNMPPYLMVYMWKRTA